MGPAAKHREHHMNTDQASTHCSQPSRNQYGLRRQDDFWQVTLQGRQSSFRHELGALYVAYLLTQSPQQAIHGVALALKAREKLGHSPSPAEALQQRLMGLEDASSVRALWRRQRELERVLEDRLEIEPVKAEALRELEELTERLRLSPWLSHHGAERCARAVAVAIQRLHARLAAAVDAQGRPDGVLRRFALHLHEYLLVPSGRGGSYARRQAQAAPGCFIYVPPPDVVWEVASPKSEVRDQRSAGEVQASSSEPPGAVDHLARFLCAGFAVALLASGCTGPRPLKGGRALTTHKPAGVIEQTLVQGENASQATKQAQETIKVRTYTLPAGSTLSAECGMRYAESRISHADSGGRSAQSRKSQALNAGPERSTINYQPSTTYTLSAPMPVVEREETRARTELGAAQKDTARELGAKLSSLKGIVWVGVGLFILGLASLVYPPLKAVIGSVTTSAAVMLGGVALMVLPSLIVGNELLILGGVAAAVGGWFLAHRHGQLSGLVAATNAAQTKPSNQSSVTSGQ